MESEDNYDWGNWEDDDYDYEPPEDADWPDNAEDSFLGDWSSM